MGKNTRHKKLVKSEKAKVKLRGKTLPKGRNNTEISFKTQKIIIQEQFKQSDSQILSRRKLDVKALLSRLQHYNMKARLKAIKELKEIFAAHAPESVCCPFLPLLQSVLSRCLDKETDVRRESLKAMNMILARVSSENLLFYSNVIILYLTRAMTHIRPKIREDSVLCLNSFLNNSVFGLLIAKNSESIILSFLDVILELKVESRLSREIVSNVAKISQAILEKKKKGVESGSLRFPNSNFLQPLRFQ